MRPNVAVRSAVTLGKSAGPTLFSRTGGTAMIGTSKRQMTGTPMDDCWEAFARVPSSESNALRQALRDLLDLHVASWRALGAIIEQCDGEDLVYAVASRAFADREGFRLRQAGSLSGLTAQSRTSQYAADTDLDRRVDRAACQALGLRAMFCAPLEVRGQTIVLKIMASQPHAFDKEQLSEISAFSAQLERALQRHAAGLPLLLAPQAQTQPGSVVGSKQLRPTVIASREVLATIEHAGELGWWTIDPSTLDMRWSEGLFRLLGADSRRQVPRLDDLLNSTHATNRATLHRLLTEPSYTEPLVTRLQGVGGALRWIRFSRELRPDDRVHFGLAQDVTALHVARSGLSRYHRAFDELAKLTGGMVWRADARGGLSFELGWCAYTGTTLAQNQGDGWVDRLHPDDRALAARLWGQARDTGSPFAARFRVRRHDGFYELFDSRALTQAGDDGLEWVGATLPVGMSTSESRAPESTVEPYPRELKAMRALADWTIQDLAEKSGVSASTITRYEGGVSTGTPIRPANLERLAQVLAAQGIRISEQGGRRSITLTPSPRSSDGNCVMASPRDGETI
jgi:PAS domain-containing protein